MLQDSKENHLKPEHIEQKNVLISGSGIISFYLPTFFLRLFWIFVVMQDSYFKIDPQISYLQQAPPQAQQIAGHN